MRIKLIVKEPFVETDSDFNKRVNQEIEKLEKEGFLILDVDLKLAEKVACVQIKYRIK